MFVSVDTPRITCNTPTMFTAHTSVTAASAKRGRETMTFHHVDTSVCSRARLSARTADAAAPTTASSATRRMTESTNACAVSDCPTVSARCAATASVASVCDGYAVSPVPDVPDISGVRRVLCESVVMIRCVCGDSPSLSADVMGVHGRRGCAWASWDLDAVSGKNLRCRSEKIPRTAYSSS